MKKIFLSTIIISILIFCIQTDVFGQISKFEQNFKYGLDIGVNSSKPLVDSIEYEASVLPSLGAYGTYRFGKLMGLHLSGRYSMRGGIANGPYHKLRVTYLDLDAQLHFYLTDFLSFYGGYQYNHYQNAVKITLSGNNPSGSQKEEIQGYVPYYQFIVGGELKLSPTAYLNFAYGFKNENTQFSHFRIGVKIDLSVANRREVIKDEIETTTSTDIEAFKKNGILLVRLPSGRSTVAALDSLNMQEKKYEYQAMIKEKNEEIIKAFKTAYHFTDVYFFYDYNSDKVTKLQSDSVLFDFDQNYVSKRLSGKTLYIAEFGRGPASEASYHIRRDYQYLKENKIDFDSSAAYIYSSDQGLGVGGLVLMKSDFSYAEKPYPTFIKMYNQTIFRAAMTKETAVRKLNNALIDLHRESTIN